MLTPLLAAVITIATTSQPVKVDGRIDPQEWAGAARIDSFVEVYPGENIPPAVRTEVFLAYDRENLYIAFQCQDPEPSKVQAHYADRDGAGADDWVGVFLDTFNDRRRALYFKCNPLGIQSDSAQSESFGGDTSWDTLWDSAGRLTETGFEVEMAIPFKSLRFPNSDRQTWGITLQRYYQRGTAHTLESRPNDRNNSCYLCQEDTLEGIEGVRPGKNIELIPAVTAQRSDEREEPAGPMNSGGIDTEAGLTGSLGLTSNLTLSGTINPDFSQVEADAFQLDVNQRFALYFPEKRPFFIEGAQYFSTPMEVFYTRSIAEPVWGLKFTGKEGAMSYGALVAQDKNCDILIPGTEGSETIPWDADSLATAFRLQRDVGKNNSLGLVTTWRSADGYDNLLTGLDGQFRLSDQDTVSVQGLFTHTQYPTAEQNPSFDGDTVQGNAYQAGYAHSGREWYWNAYYHDRDDEYRADLGYDPQVGYRSLSSYAARLWRGDGKTWYTTIELGASGFASRDEEGEPLGQGASLSYYILFPVYSSSLHIVYERDSTTYNNKHFPGQDWAQLRISGKPAPWLSIVIYTQDYDAVDYVNEQPGKGKRHFASLSLKPGRRLAWGLTFTRSRLDVDEGMLYKADIIYTFVNVFLSRRFFIRGILQAMDLDKNPDLHPYEVPSNSKRLSSQLLFSYRINPFTLAYLGYSDNGIEDDSTPSTTMNRTYFLKLSYAWRP